MDVSEIYRWWDVFGKSTQLVEIRLVGETIGNDNKVRKSTYSGYFHNVENIAGAIAPYTSSHNVYFSINPIDEALYSRAQSERLLSTNEATADKDVVGREWVLIDIDSKRKSGICATDDEVAYTKTVANKVYGYLLEVGFNRPVVIFSSSGVHFYLKCHIACTEENDKLIKRFLQALSMRFSDERTEVDTTVFNRARISRLPGTFSRKGRDTLERPQRMCSFVQVPREVKVNDIAYFKKVASEFPEDETPPYRSNNYSRERFDLDSFIARHGIEVTKVENIADGKKYVLDHCPFDPSHRGKDAVIFQRTSGEIAFFCFHSSCQNHHWRDFRLLYEPNAYDKVYEERDYFGRDFRKVTPKEPFIPQKTDEEKGPKWIKLSSVKKVKIDPADYIPSGIEQLDRLIIGFKRKQVSVWSGYRGAAKSTLLNMLILNGAQRGYKSALWTGELDSREVKTWLYLQAAGKRWNEQSQFSNFYYTPDRIIDKIDPWIDKYLWLYNDEYSDDYEQIENEIRELKEKEDIDFAILDNLMVLDIDGLGKDKYDDQKQVMKRLSRLAKELNIHIHVVAHPNKAGSFLRPNSISGSGNIADIAQNVLIAHRINRDFENASREFLSPSTVNEILDSNCTNTVEICKCRDKGMAVDKFIKLYFEIESNRLKDRIDESITYTWDEEPTQMGIGDMPDFDNEEWEN